MAAAAEALEAQALAVGLPDEIQLVPGAGHGFDISSVLVTPSETMFDRFVDFSYTEVAYEPPAVQCGLGAELVPLLGLLACRQRRKLSWSTRSRSRGASSLVRSSGPRARERATARR